MSDRALEELKGHALACLLMLSSSCAIMRAVQSCPQFSSGLKGACAHSR